MKKVLIVFFILLISCGLHAKKQLKFNNKIYSHDSKINFEFINVYNNIKNIIKEFNSIKNKAKIYNNSNIIISTNQYLEFNAEYFDYGEMHDTGNNNDKVYVTQADSGYFFIGLSLKITPLTSASVKLSIFKNNNKIAIESVGTVSEETYATFSTVSDGQRDDYYRVYIETDSQVTVEINNNTSVNEQLGLSIFRLE